MPGIERLATNLITIAIAKARAIKGIDHCRRRGNGRSYPTGGMSERAVVVTFTVNGAPLAPLTVTLEGEAVHIVCAGAPLHARLTCPTKSLSGFTCKL